MSTYEVQQDPPWMRSSLRYSTAPSMSVYSEDEDRSRMDDDLPPVTPLEVQKPAHSPYHAHPDQQITDSGPQARQSKLPVFQQVRSMLRKPPPSSHPLKYDEFSGNPSETGRPAFMKASEYKLPEREDFRSRLRRSSDLRAKSMRSLSPVSLLRTDEMDRSSPVSNDGNFPRPQSPVSPVSRVSTRSPVASEAVEPFPAFANPRSSSLPQKAAHVPQIKVPKRKPVVQTIPENTPPPDLSSRPQSPQGDDETNTESGTPQRDPESHFSWTTYAPSVRQGSMDLRNSGRVSYDTQRQSDLMASRFSWSTVATGMTHQTRPDSPPPSPPPPVPEKFKQAPVQSILSRQRPIPRDDRDDDDGWTPPPPPKTRPVALDPSTALTPAQRRNFTMQSNSSSKKLPLPPELASPATPLSHLEALQKQEEDIRHQRKNIERLIAEDSKIEKASPIDVSFSAVRDAKKRLEERNITLAEVLLEEREIGILISRARRRDGEEDGLWVRRVTG